MEKQELEKRLACCRKVLVGLGEEWKITRNDAKQEKRIRQAYETLYRILQDKDYFIVTMATDAVIFDTPLGSEKEHIADADSGEYPPELGILCRADEETLEKFNRLFPATEKKTDSRMQRIVAPCGNETWCQCSVGCTKDIWEPGEIPDDICPYCGAPLTGNTVEAQPYIEEGYLPQWMHYNQWLSRTLGQELVILELGVGFSKPGVIRFPFEKTAYFNQKAYLCRVHRRFPQVPQEIGSRASGVEDDSVLWILNNFS